MKDLGAHPNRRPLLALILLSPVIAEMLSGSTPPLEWLNPIAVLFLIWLYGAGVLVMRETAVRWKTGWPSILLLAAAYRITAGSISAMPLFHDFRPPSAEQAHLASLPRPDPRI